ncbi:EAL domain-containing protein [Colwellia sp. UCD-KL20]|uniref:sensor domain-containing phosphodiesterase n=1 Tax=Colwellia sp. UCD-KL20 TaxID=1917165 RepID=UPI0009FAEDBB|nr:EAL domain-containing protein [Colwellia sp. UCD-KL20]
MDLSSENLDDLRDSEKELVKEAIKLRDKYQQLERRHDVLCKINQLSSEINQLPLFLKQIHLIIKSFAPADNICVAIFEPTFQTIEFPYWVDEKTIYPNQPVSAEKYKDSLISYVLKTKKPLLADQEKIKQLIDSNQADFINNDTQQWLGVPLLKEGYVTGVIAIASRDEHTIYDESQLDILSFVAQQVMSGINCLQHFEILNKAVDARTSELMQHIRDREKSDLLQESLFKISELTSDIKLDISDFYSKVHNIVGQLINTANFYIAKHSSESNVLTFVYYSDQLLSNESPYFKPRIMSNYLTELVIRKGEMLLLSHKDIEALYQQGEIDDFNEKTTTWLGVPLIHSGNVLGAMVIQSYQNKVVYTEQDAELLNFVSHHISSAIRRKDLMTIERQSHDILEQQVKLRTLALEEEIAQRKLAEQQLTHTASHDNLTGLANRIIFIDLLNHAIASSKRFPERLFAILFLDLDRFKVVNDSLGHHAGDKLLKIVAKELLDIVRNKDTVARFGGDEFVILIEDLESEERAYEVADRITKFLSTPFLIDDHPVYIGTSIGVLFNNERYDNADLMLRDADIAMYHAKEKGRGRYEVFDSSMHSNIQNALTLEADIRDAIEAKEFIPYYQPIVQLDTGKIMGFEALARWESDKRGFVFPDDFIPLAEERNLVMAIDLQILEKSCLQIKKWQNQFGCKNLYISCNLYSGHFFKLSLVEEISNILDNIGISPSNLRIELTERALLDNSDIVLENMKALKKLGVKILLDDFGTGYSSLSYLHLFPIDVLKIDRSFITNVHDDTSHQAIIKTIIDLATNLDMATVGEGIESIEDANILKAMDCQFGQGYYFSKPMKASDAEYVLLRSFGVK